MLRCNLRNMQPDLSRQAFGATGVGAGGAVTYPFAALLRLLSPACTPSLKCLALDVDLAAVPPDGAQLLCKAVAQRRGLQKMELYCVEGGSAAKSTPVPSSAPASQLSAAQERSELAWTKTRARQHIGVDDDCLAQLAAGGT